MSDLIERLERTPEYIDTDEDQRIADLCDEAVHEILRLRNRVWELEDKLHAARVGACEVSDEKDARIRELEKQLGCEGDLTITKVYVLSIVETWEVDLATEVIEDVRTRVRVFASDHGAIREAERAAHLPDISATPRSRLVDVSTSIVQQEIER